MITTREFLPLYTGSTPNSNSSNFSIYRAKSNSFTFLRILAMEHGSLPRTQVSADNGSDDENSKGRPRPCCTCKDTRAARDDCFLRYGDEAGQKCSDLIKAHVECMRSFGFKIWVRIPIHSISPMMYSSSQGVMDLSFIMACGWELGDFSGVKDRFFAISLPLVVTIRLDLKKSSLAAVVFRRRFDAILE